MYGNIFGPRKNLIIFHLGRDIGPPLEFGPFWDLAPLETDLDPLLDEGAQKTFGVATFFFILRSFNVPFFSKMVYR